MINNKLLFLVPLEEHFLNGAKGGAISIWLRNFSKFYPNYTVLAKHQIGDLKLIRFKYFFFFKTLNLIPFIRRIGDLLFVYLHYSQMKNYDTIVIHNSYRFLKYIPNSVEVVIHFHNNYSKNFSLEFVNYLRKRTKKVIVCSYFLQDEFSKLGIKSKVIYNGVNQDIFKVDINSKRNDIVYLGRIDQNKNLYSIINLLFKYCKSRNLSTLKLSIIGVPDFSFFSNLYYLKCKLLSFYVKYKSNLQVEFLGSIKHDNLSDLLNSFKLIISLPLYDEAFGMNVVEAQFCGCLPMVNNIGGLLENNFYLNYSEVFLSSSDYFSILDKLLNDVKFSTDLISINSNKYDWNVISREYINFIISV